MLKWRVLTPAVSAGFQQPDSWTDCLCSNTLLCQTLFSAYIHTHTHKYGSHNSLSPLVHTSTSLNTSHFSSLCTQLVFSAIFLSPSSPPQPLLPHHLSFCCSFRHSPSLLSSQSPSTPSTPLPFRLSLSSLDVPWRDLLKRSLGYM